MVRVQIRDYLKATAEGDDLALDMFLKYPVKHVAPRANVSRSVRELYYKKRIGHARQQSDPDFLIKHLENLSARAALEQFTVHLEAPDRFTTAFCRTEIKGSVVGRVVCPGLGQCLDDVVDLFMGRDNGTACISRVSTLVRERPQRTWVMSTCVPAFNPEATQSSSVFSNRFFSLTTAFRKSVLSMCGAYTTCIVHVQNFWF